MQSDNKGAAYAALSGLFFGLIGYFGVSVINADISVSTMLFWRFLVSGLFISIILISSMKTIPANVNAWELFKVALSGALFYGVCSIFYFIATKYIGTGLSMVIFFTYPAIVMLINFLFYKHKISKIYYLAITIIFIGLLFLTHGEGVKFDVIGIGLSLLSAVLYALYLITSKNTPVPSLLATLMVSIGCMAVCLIASLMDNTFKVPVGLNVWLNICGIGIICTALPIVLLLQGLKQISSVQASILSVLEPVFVVIFGILLLDEKINLIQAVGVLILLSGALLALLSER